MANTYTPEQRTEAVAIYVQHGLAHAHHATGVPRGTLRDWAKADGHDLAALSAHTGDQTRAANAAHAAELETRRLALRQKLIDGAHRMIERMEEAEVDYRGRDADRVEFAEASANSCRAFATAAAILIDKLRLELGEATDRVEHRTVDQVTAEVERLAAELADDPKPDPVPEAA